MAIKIFVLIIASAFLGFLISISHPAKNGTLLEGLSSGISIPVQFQQTDSTYSPLATGPTTTAQHINTLDGINLGRGTSTSWTLGIGTSTPFDTDGISFLSIYGTTTIQTPLNTRRAFRIQNAATSTVFQVDTISTRVGIGTSTASTTFDVYTSGTTTMMIDSIGAIKGGCLAIKDTDGIGYTYLTVLNGVATFSDANCN